MIRTSKVIRPPLLLIESSGQVSGPGDDPGSGYRRSCGRVRAANSVRSRSRVSTWASCIASNVASSIRAVVASCHQAQTPATMRR
jgi:hypothetical protein